MRWSVVCCVVNLFLHSAEAAQFNIVGKQCFEVSGVKYRHFMLKRQGGYERCRYVVPEVDCDETGLAYTGVLRGFLCCEEDPSMPNCNDGDSSNCYIWKLRQQDHGIDEINKYFNKNDKNRLTPQQKFLDCSTILTRLENDYADPRDRQSYVLQDHQNNDNTDKGKTLPAGQITKKPIYKLETTTNGVKDGKTAGKPAVPGDKPQPGVGKPDPSVSKPPNSGGKDSPDGEQPDGGEETPKYDEMLNTKTTVFSEDEDENYDDENGKGDKAKKGSKKETSSDKYKKRNSTRALPFAVIGTFMIAIGGTMMLVGFLKNRNKRK